MVSKRVKACDGSQNFVCVVQTLWKELRICHASAICPNWLKSASVRGNGCIFLELTICVYEDGSLKVSRVKPFCAFLCV